MKIIFLIFVAKMCNLTPLFNQKNTEDKILESYLSWYRWGEPGTIRLGWHNLSHPNMPLRSRIVGRSEIHGLGWSGEILTRSGHDLLTASQSITCTLAPEATLATAGSARASRVCRIWAQSIQIFMVRPFVWSTLGAGASLWWKRKWEKSAVKEVKMIIAEKIRGNGGPTARAKNHQLDGVVYTATGYRGRWSPLTETSGEIWGVVVFWVSGMEVT